MEETLDQDLGSKDGKYRRYVSNIIVSSRRLLDLINDLLDLAKIEAGRMDLRVSSVSVADTAEGLTTLMKPQAEKNRITLDHRVDPNIPLVQTDAGKFQQILFNLLSNALKFTPPHGRVTLSAQLMPDSNTVPLSEGDQTHRRWLSVSVADTGPGIALEHHEQIFDKFTQLDSTVTREHSGTGLGLAISRELATLLQGRIELDSDTGQGATFSLIIPLSLESRHNPLMPLADHDSSSHRDDASLRTH